MNHLVFLPIISLFLALIFENTQGLKPLTYFIFNVLVVSLFKQKVLHIIIYPFFQGSKWILVPLIP